MKNQAKADMKNHYFRNIVLVFITFFIVNGGYTYKTGNIINVDIQETANMVISQSKDRKSNAQIVNELLDKKIDEFQYKPTQEHNLNRGVLSVFVNQITDTGSFVFGVVNALNIIAFSGEAPAIISIVFSMSLMFVIFLFIQNIIIIGKNRYFLEQRRYKDTRIDKLMFPYKKRETRHLAYILFFRYLYQVLWNLTIIGGVIKYYEYRMIPYILAENPTISKDDAFSLSKEMAYGEKMELFKTDLSMIGWHILGMVTFNLSNVLFFNVYKEFLYAEIYMDIRSKKKFSLTHGELLNDSLLEIPYKEDGEYPENELYTSYDHHRQWLSLDYKKSYSLINYILFFFTFSVMGWIWEVSMHFFNTGVFVNRGTLLGPWLPIYGVGGVCILFLCKPLRDKPLQLFFAAFILCGIIEYSTAWYLETFKHMKWWDYSGYFLNIQGRICLEGLLVFGIGGCGFTYILAPMLDNIFNKFKKNLRIIICVILIVLFCSDLIYSHYHPNTGKGITTSSNIKQNSLI